MAASRTRTVKRITRCFIVCVTLAGIPHEVRPQEETYSFSVKGSFTISSRLFYNIDARDEISRGQYLSLDDIFGLGIDVRRSIGDTRILIGISGEYLSTEQVSFIRLGNTKIPVEDGYWTVPVELSGYFIIPFSSDVARLYIGGGVGMYFGERKYAVAEERADIVDSEMGIGIHIVTGFEYSLSSWFALKGEVKFRDLQFESTHAFSKSSTVYNGVTVLLRQEPTRSRVNVDGMLIDAGIAIRF